MTDTTTHNSSPDHTPDTFHARFILLSGHVQGVGFRPFVYRLAMEHGITGWIENRMGQVAIHAQGTRANLRRFELDILRQAPPHSTPVIHSIHDAENIATEGFEIRKSRPNRLRDTRTDIRLVPDLPVCGQCRIELKDQSDRRYRYPFTNCTQCGPRYTIITALPYDRINTSMHAFPMCADCTAEYQDISNRRFHAEPIACPVCGPVLEYHHRETRIVENDAAIRAVVNDLGEGRIIAVKGIGGYHLLCDARNDDAVKRLRMAKHRPHKPLAIMLPGNNRLGQWGIGIQDIHREILGNPVHPIVLATVYPDTCLSNEIAPGLQEIGVMLPYSPLHEIILEDFGFPVVATSANLSGEPVLTEAQDVETRLGTVADSFLHHNRGIQRPADDPVYRVIDTVARPLRLSRGNAPLERELPFSLPQPLLATGGHMKNTVALAWDRRIVLSPHIGDLDSARSRDVFTQVIADLQALYHVQATRIITDAHPGYASTRWAKQQGLPLLSVPHHHAHASAVAGEYSHETDWLVFTWDGVGLGADPDAGPGTDQALWGGEAFLGRPGAWRHAASMREFRLPGGEKAGREPWRSALAMLWENDLEWNPDSGHAPANIDMLRIAWENRLNCPRTSAVGRLFDGAASLLNLLQTSSFEGQGPMYLEAIAEKCTLEPPELPLHPDANKVLRADWSALLSLLRDPSIPAAHRAWLFHRSMADTLLQQACRLRDIHGDFAVGLGGGVFQNRLLSELSLDLLRANGFRAYLPEAIPVNDGGLCYGQMIEAGYRIQP